MTSRALVLVFAAAISACSAADSTLITCTSSLPDFGRPCRSASGCPGIYACDDTGTELACNAPDRCACADNLLLDSSCFGTDGCQGRYSLCDGDGATLICVCPSEPPACGPTTAGYGDACRSAAGCPGKMACDAKNKALACDAPASCACADKASWGGACTGAGGCAGAFTSCEADGTTLRCDCAASCTASTPGVGDACRGATGCPGTKQCDAAGKALVCNAPSVCACSQQVAYGTACTGAGGCAGRYDACEADGTTLRCTCPPACSPSTAGYGQSCRSAEGCPGTFSCNANASALSCNAPSICACADRAAWNTTCSGAGGCSGRYDACEADGTTLRCNCPVTCSSQTAGYGTSCTTSSGCRGKKLCSSGALTCLGADTCRAGVVISEVAPGGTGSTQDEFVELYNASGTSIDLSGMNLLYRFENTVTPTNPVVIAMATIPANTTLPAGAHYLLTRSGSYTGSVAGDLTFDVNVATSKFSLFLMRPVAAGEVDDRTYISGFTPDQSVPAGLGRIVDVVGIGTGGLYEGTPLTWSSSNPPLASFERKARAASTAASMADAASDGTLGNAQDTHDNAADFVLRAARDPQNRASPVEP